jgi:acyl-CoA thioesterase-1
MISRRSRLLAGILLFGLVLSGCTAGESTQSKSNPPSSSPEQSSTEKPKIVVLGDSLTAGYGMSRDAAFPALIQERLDEEGLDYEVVNAGVPGDTSAGGLRRLEWALDGEVRVLIVALGGNDGLRGLAVSEMKRNLATMIETANERGVHVILAGMEAPPNQGESYTTGFRNAFRELTEEYDVVFFPFLLKDVAGRAELNQADGIHPNRDGARVIADNLWEYLEPLIESERNP